MGEGTINRTLKKKKHVNAWEKNMKKRNRDQLLPELSFFKSVYKKGKFLKRLDFIKSLPLGVDVKEEKLRDLDRLLALHFGVDWRQLENLHFYATVLDGERVGNPGTDDLSMEEEMAYFEKREELRV